MTYDEYEKIKTLHELLNKGSITQEELEREKEKILSGKQQQQKTAPTSATTGQPLGLDENPYLLLMHLSQFISAIIIPLIMWLVARDNNKRIDLHGKNIINFLISYTIWFIIGLITIPLVIGIVIISVWGIAIVVFIIVASIKAYNGEDWQYPITIQFLK